jgi:hypothetical protein
MEAIKFSYNWNNKLNNKAFTTIRLHNPNKYQQGKQYRIECKGELKGIAVLHEIRVFTTDKLNDFVTYLDTGYNVHDTIKLLKTMYKNSNIDWNRQRLDFCLLVYQKEDKRVKLSSE